MSNDELVSQINQDLLLALPEKISREEIFSKLAEHLNELIKNDFEKLVSYLYRIDVSEPKLKQLLAQYPEQDAGHIIAELIVERQEQKLKTRRQFGQRDNQIDEEEKW